MAYYLVKIAVTIALIVAISEIAKRSPLIAGVLASIPLVSVLAIIWLYVETRDAARVAALAENILWLVPPSLVLFLVLPRDAAPGVQLLREPGRRGRGHGHRLLRDALDHAPLRHRDLGPGARAFL